jgi:hypothetical protein
VLLFGVLARQRGGHPVRWGVLAASTVGLHLAVLLGGVLLSGGLSGFYAALLHRNEAAVPESVLFAATWQLVVALAVGAAAVAVLVGRRLGARRAKTAPPPGQLELVSAMALTTVLPVVLLGRMEGNTGAVVILSGLGLAVAMPALRLGARLHKAR